MIESNAQDALLLRGIIATATSHHFQLTHAYTLAESLQRLKEEYYDIILMDLVLSDSQGFPSFRAIKDHAPDVPILVVSEVNDDDVAVQLAKEGAEDYLVKGYLENSQRGLSPPVLARSIRYAIERHRLQLALKRYTQELQSNEKRFRVIIDKSADGIIIVDHYGIVQFVNPAAEQMFSRPAEKLLGESFGFPVVAGDNAELDVLRPNGRHLIVEMRVVEITWENTLTYLATFRDVTQRKQAETRQITRYNVTRVLAQSETFWEAVPLLLQSICDGNRWDVGEIWLVDPDVQVLRWAGFWHTASISLPSFEHISSTMTKELEDGLYGAVWKSGQPVWAGHLSDEQHQLPRASLLRAAGLTTVVAFPIFSGRAVTGVLAFFSRLAFDHDNDTIKMMGDIGNQIGQFIGRRRAEEELRSAHRALRTLNECNQALIHATDESAFLHDICRIIVEVGGYSLAWAGFAEQDEADCLRIVAQAGYEHGYIEHMDVSWANTTRGQGPTMTALRTGKPCIAKNILADPGFSYTQNTEGTLGYASFVALPLITSSRPFGVLSIFTEEPDAFGKEEVRLLMEMANDLAYGIIALRTRSERDQAERALRLYTERLKNMREIDQAILSAQTPEAIAQAALSHIRRMVPYQWASIVSYEVEAGTPVTLVSDVKGSGTDESFASTGSQLPLFLPNTLEGIPFGSARYVEDIQELSERSTDVRPLLAFGIRSYISAPLLADGQLIGGINLGSVHPRAFDEQHLSIAHEVADQMAVAIQHARLFEQVRAGRERLQTLSRRLMEIQEVERHHIARELHDEIGQSLTAVKISMQAIQRLPEAQALYQSLDGSITIVEQALGQVRNLSLDLRPSLLDDLGLEAALRWYIDRQAQWTELHVEFVTDLVVPRLPTDLETACFRVTQEALTNVIRHARATRVRVELEQHAQEIHLIVRDNGVGFDVLAAQKRAVRGSSLGLLGMQERVLFAGGTIDIRSSPDQGTEVYAKFPLRDAVPDEPLTESFSTHTTKKVL